MACVSLLKTGELKASNFNISSVVDWEDFRSILVSEINLLSTVKSFHSPAQNGLIQSILFLGLECDRVC